ncbi:MAG TPA: hypothetical protein VLA92_02605 [Candidatus Saccharimonadales bacterium]|nr:hypothetical protein [Candidatus Saccharimonadales bacterium]
MTERYALDLTKPEAPFEQAHARLVEMLAHATPLDVSLAAGKPVSAGRVRLEASMATEEKPATITEIEHHYHRTGDQLLVNKLTTVLSLRDRGVVAVQYEEMQEEPSAKDRTSKLWVGPEPAVLSDTLAAEKAEDIYTSVELMYKQNKAAVAHAHENQLY